MRTQGNGRALVALLVFQGWIVRRGDKRAYHLRAGFPMRRAKIDFGREMKLNSIACS
jgi:hypothetical protein